MIGVVVSPDSGCRARRRRGECLRPRSARLSVASLSPASPLLLRDRNPRYTRGPCSAFYGRTTSAARGAVRDVSQVERR